MARSPVVYLPGVDGTGRLLHRQAGLNARHAVRCVEYPQDDRHTYPDLTRLAVRTLEETGPAVVLAESFGGAVALMAALERPDLVRRLVLVNTFAHYPRGLSIRLLGGVGPWLPDRPGHPATRGVRGYFFFHRDIPPAERAEWWGRTADVRMRVYGHRFRLLAGLDLRPKLAAVRTPALVFAAADDWVAPAPAGRLLAARLPHATGIGWPVGHAALIHPTVDVAAWLEEPAYWPFFSGPPLPLRERG